MASDKMQSKLCERISELEKENKQFKWEFNEVVKDNDYYQKENKELKAQIEKMKNVGNCRHAMQCPLWVEHKIKNDGIKACLNCDKWELEE